MRPDVQAHVLDSLGDAREVARRSLTWLADYQAARSVSLWRSIGDAVSLELGAVLDEATLTGARRAVAAEHADLDRGAPVLRGRSALVPTSVAHCFAYVEDVEPERLDVETTARIATFALRMLKGEERPAPGRGAGLLAPDHRSARPCEGALFPIGPKAVEA